MTRTSTLTTSRPRAAGARALALGALACLAACQTQPTLRGTNVQVTEAGRVAVTNPADIAIAPVEKVAAVNSIPTEPLRVAAQKSLVKKRYSPLSLKQVDGAMVGLEPASYRPGMLREEAVLELTVHGWNDSLWSSRNTLVVDVEARLVEPDAPAGATLWAARLSQRFDFTPQRRESTTDEGLIQIACDRVLDELLSKLPARDAQPGPRGGLN